MSHLVLELLLWIVFAFFVGCILGCVFRRLVRSRAGTVVASAATRPAATKHTPLRAPASAKVAAAPSAKPRHRAKCASLPPPQVRSLPLPQARSRTGVAKPGRRRVTKPPDLRLLLRRLPACCGMSGKPQQPKGIAAPRSGKPDDLKLVSGIGPKIERTLHGLGYFHFDQIASWTADEVQWVDERLKFKGRIVREDWQSQARLLAGGTTESERNRQPARSRTTPSYGRQARQKVGERRQRLRRQKRRQVLGVQRRQASVARVASLDRYAVDRGQALGLVEKRYMAPISDGHGYQRRVKFFMRSTVSALRRSECSAAQHGDGNLA